MAKPEILKLSALPNVHVRLAIEENKKLDAILAQALNRSTGDSMLTELERLNVESLCISDALVCEHQKFTY